MACASFALGAMLPWIPPASGDDHVEPTTPHVASAGLSAREQPAAPSPKPAEGIIAIGDKSLHHATPCLRKRDVDVHPRNIRSVDALRLVTASLGRTYGAVLVHVTGLDNLVDGHIREVMEMVPEGSRVIWVTVKRGGAAWGAFSSEDRINASIRNVVGRASEGRVLDWRSATERNPEWLLGDSGLSVSGCNAYAAMVVKLSGQTGKA
jgi:hypothetical protein